MQDSLNNNDSKEQLSKKKISTKVWIFIIAFIVLVCCLSFYFYSSFQKDKTSKSELKEDALKKFFNEFYYKNPRCIKYGDDARECIGLFRKEFYKNFNEKDISSFIKVPMTLSFTKKFSKDNVSIEMSRNADCGSDYNKDFKHIDENLYLVEFSASPEFSAEYKTNIKVYAKVADSIFSKLQEGKKYKLGGIFSGYYIDRDKVNRRKTEFGYPPMVKKLYGEIWISTGNLMVNNLKFEEIK